MDFAAGDKPKESLRLEPLHNSLPVRRTDARVAGCHAQQIDAESGTLMGLSAALALAVPCTAAAFQSWREEQHVHNISRDEVRSRQVCNHHYVYSQPKGRYPLKRSAADEATPAVAATMPPLLNTLASQSAGHLPRSSVLP
jgi:hypothetical protein